MLWYAWVFLVIAILAALFGFGGIAGAAVGSVLLGPGLGTSVGAKLGNMAEGLFGKKDDKKKK